MVNQQHQHQQHQQQDPLFCVGVMGIEGREGDYILQSVASLRRGGVGMRAGEQRRAVAGLDEHGRPHSRFAVSTSQIPIMVYVKLSIDVHARISLSPNLL